MLIYIQNKTEISFKMLFHFNTLLNTISHNNNIHTYPLCGTW